jgi:O-antigen/teichoic acid export membrane protein
MSVMGFLIAWFAPDYLKAPLEFVGTVRLTAGLLMANIIIIGLADVPHSALRGANLDYKSIGTSTFLVIANGWTDYLAIYLRTGISGVAFTDILITIATGAFFIRIARENIAWLGIKLPIRDELRRFFSLNWWFIGWQLVVQAMLVGDVVLLGILLSPNIVTIYVITKYALDVATNLIVTAIAGILPGLGGIIGAGEVKKAAQLRGEMISLIWLLATCIGSTILLMDRSFIAIWVGKQYDAGWINLLLITIMMIQLVIIRGDASIIDVTLKLRHKVYWGIVSVTVSLMLAGFMIKYFSLGIGGLCLGFILGQSILTFAYPWLIGKELGISFVSQLKQCVRPAGVTILLFAISIYLSQFIWTDNWIMLGVSCAVTFSLAMLLAYLGGLPEYLRKNLLERFLRILPVSQ